MQCGQLIARCYLHIWWYFSCKNWARKTDAPKKNHRKHNSRIIALYALDFLLTAALVGVSENLQPFWEKYASMLRKIILLVKLSQDCQPYLPSQDKRKSYEEENHHWLLRKSMYSASPASQYWVRGHDPYLYSFWWICSSTSKHYLTEKLKNPNVCVCYSPLGLTKIDDIYVWKDYFNIILNMSNLPKELSRNWRLILILNQVLIIMPPLSFFWISTFSERQEIKEIEQGLQYTFRDCACLKHPRL